MNTLTAPRTTALVRHLVDHGILATGLNYPVVPKGDETIRFQVSADHTEADIDQVLDHGPHAPVGVKGHEGGPGGGLGDRLDGHEKKDKGNERSRSDTSLSF